jgi:hypothetical protein
MMADGRGVEAGIDAAKEDAQAGCDDVAHRPTRCRQQVGTRWPPPRNSPFRCVQSRSTGINIDASSFKLRTVRAHDNDAVAHFHSARQKRSGPDTPLLGTQKKRSSYTASIGYDTLHPAA